MKPSKPNAPALNLKEFFAESYAVPFYQREYSWSIDEVDDLFTDLLEFSNSKQLYYFLGQVIVADCDDDERYYIIDGQQRTTTIMILLAAIRSEIEHLPNFKSDKNLGYLNNELSQLLQFPKMDGLAPRVKVADDGEWLMKILIQGSQRPDPEDDWSNTKENLAEASVYLESKIKEIFQKPDDLVEFYKKIINGAMFVRLEMSSEEEAIGVYERTNNRGLELDSADLIKNSTFSKLKKVDFESAAEEWSKASRILRECSVERVRKMQFLLRAMIIGIKGETISSKRIREAWASEISNQAAAKQFLADLPSRAKSLARISNGKIPKDGKDHSDLGNTARYFRFVQHYPILLAGSHLNRSAYIKLSELTENRVLLSILVAERAQDFESIVGAWAKNILKLDSKASATDVVKASTKAFTNINELMDRMKLAVKSLRYTNQSDRKRIRFILARLSREIQEEAREAHVPALSELIKRRRRAKKNSKATIGYDLEHIRSKAVHGDKDLTHSIGNLVLAHSADQRAKGAAEPKDKIGIYQDSYFLLTRSLADPLSKDLKVKRRSVVLKRLQNLAPPSLTKWSDEAINKRTKMYFELLRDSINSCLDIP